ncbi:hypothetical protein [Phenylobacterium sp.]|nr:hypothetical protein [Phenylobacterium sp.]MDP3592668.1 hypothetical protein [Phenylobacterium sp.]
MRIFKRRSWRRRRLTMLTSRGWVVAATMIGLAVAAFLTWGML